MAEDRCDVGKASEIRSDDKAAASDVEQLARPPPSDAQTNPLHAHNFGMPALRPDKLPFAVVRAEQGASAKLTWVGGAANVNLDAAKPAALGASPRDALAIIRLLILGSSPEAETAAVALRAAGINFG